MTTSPSAYLSSFENILDMSYINGNEFSEEVSLAPDAVDALNEFIIDLSQVGLLVTLKNVQPIPRSSRKITQTLIPSRNLLETFMGAETT